MSHAYSYSIIYFVRNYCFFSDKIEYAHYFSWSKCAKVGSFLIRESSSTTICLTSCLMRL